MRKLGKKFKNCRNMKNKNIILMLNLAYYRNAGVFPKTIYIVAEITAFNQFDSIFPGAMPAL